MASSADTRLALVRARQGIPSNALPELEPSALDIFLGEYADAVRGQLPRAVRRAGYADVVGNEILNAANWGFWLGAAYVVLMDRES